MPNLVVYVPARVARALEARGVSEDVQRRACKEVLVGLADGELGAAEKPSEVVGPKRLEPVKKPPQSDGRSSSAAPSSFRPDFKGGSKR